MCVPSHLSHVQLCATLWTVACQVPLSMGFSRQEYWSGLPFPSPGDRPNPEVKSMSLTSPALAAGFFTTNTTWEAREQLEANKRDNLEEMNSFLERYSILRQNQGEIGNMNRTITSTKIETLIKIC